MPRRERWSIIGAILAEVERESQRGPQARISAIASRANLPHDRLHGYLDELHAMGLIEGERFPVLTDKGRAFLREYRLWLQVLSRFGITPDADDPGRPGKHDRRL